MKSEGSGSLFLAPQASSFKLGRTFGSGFIPKFKTDFEARVAPARFTPSDSPFEK